MKNPNLSFLGMAFLLLAMAVPTSAQVLSNDNEDEVYKIDQNFAKDFVPGQVLVKMKDGNPASVRRVKGRFQSAGISELDKVLSLFDVEDMEQLLPNASVGKTPRRAKAYNGDVITERDLTQLYKISLAEEEEDKTLELVEELQALDEVEFAEPNYKVYIMANDNIADDYSSNPMVSQQWYLDAYGVKELWDKPIINKTRPVIAIIDTGVDITHPDLKDNIWTNQTEADGRADYDNDRNGFKNDIHGWDFINNTPKMRDNNMHGTHVAGIAAAANNGVGIVGANPQALIMPITVMQSDGSGDVATIVKGIDYAVKNGATIINMSIGGYYNSNAERQALERAYQSAVIVAAAGNDGKCIYASHWKQHDAAPCFPAAYSFVLGVQATISSGGLASFSNYDDDGPTTSCESSAQDPDGFNYELKAPGTQIMSTIPGGGYRDLQGTSMASPIVAGAISALMMVKQYDNQEILWGDLLHSDNIAKAYKIANRPAELDITRIVLCNRNEQTDDDLKYYDVNVGETLNIYPVIRTTFGSASNIKLKIEVPSEVEALIGDADFGYRLNAYGKMTSKNPLTIKIPDEMPNASEIKITIQATCQESDKTCSCDFTLRVANRYTLKGLLTQNMTLTPDHVYYVSGEFGVSEGTTLTIKPGTRLEFGKKAGLYGFGTLNIKGTPEAPIIMTAYDKSNPWMGIYSHAPNGRYEYDGIYTNSDTTLFTFVPTKETPVKMSTFWQRFYYDIEENKPTSLRFTDYFDNWAQDMTSKNALLINPDYLTPAMLKMMADWKAYFQKYPTQQTGEMNKSVYICLNLPSWFRYTNPTDTLAYCRIDGFYNINIHFGHVSPYWCDCIIAPTPNPWGDSNGEVYLYGERNVFNNSTFDAKYTGTNYTNIVNNKLSVGLTITANTQYTSNYLGKSNFFNNFYIDPKTNKKIMLRFISSSPETVKIDPLPYLGTAREEIIRPLIYEYGNTDGVTTGWQQATTYATLDLSNMQKEPYHEAHGIVWKVLVNGKDTQDEQEYLLPLGVGKHKFEVYFNRPMNKAVTPQISFGPSLPYTKQAVTDNCSWNDEGTIYTAYVTIDGKTQCDGINRIYVRNAEDDEFFPCPYEATRFNIMVQAAGSMASGLQADACLGCVRLKWNNENNDFEDAMGFNVYRYTASPNPSQGGEMVYDTIRINKDILDITTTSYIDDDVTPGQTYYYYYKVLSTALQEYDVSNVVAATPLTATLGDANGSGEVDVADIITTVNYVTGLQPKPFVFDAADMNSDKLIDIFDVIGIIQKILNPSAEARAMVEATATYTIEDGTLYVESPVALAGVQVQISLTPAPSPMGEGRISVAEDLNGFEHTSAWLSDNDYLFLAYNLNGKTLTPGKHALLHIGDAMIADIRLSDAGGHNVNVIGDDATRVSRIVESLTVKGIYDLQGRKLTGDCEQEGRLPKGVYIINGLKVVR